ncbi:ferric reductase-like transmembrane domain-containing protein [Candidatus Saccharibacteria bacterium]|nr:ferric reductase-like transmembrane domain-containing protein [Candidatus Saccharibacteria bacterium]
MYKFRKLISASLLFVLATNIGVITYFWWQGSQSYFAASSVALTYIGLGRLFGLLGVLFVLQQFVLIGRIPLLEQSIGQDKLSRLHGKTGYVAFTFICLHAFFIVAGNAILTNKSLIGQSWFMTQTYDDVLKAQLALLFLFAVVGSSIWIVRKKLRYEWWHVVHLLTYAFVLFAFGHQLELGTTLNQDTVFSVYWLALYVVVLGGFGFYRFLNPLLQYCKYRFVVDKVVKESSSAVSIYISGQNMTRFNWNSGQYAIFTFLQKGLIPQPHPFSISWSPLDKDVIRVTIKAVGDYTKKLQNLKPGAKVLVEGPLGVFGQQVGPEKQVLLVAGGIGITPIRCLYERYARNGRDVVLLYAAKKREDFVLNREVEEIAQEFDNAKLVYICEDDIKGVQKGRISRELIEQHVSDIPGRRAFVCGPPAMMNAVEKLLIDLGLPKRKIFTERFSFLK